MKVFVMSQKTLLDALQGSFLGDLLILLSLGFFFFFFSTLEVVAN